MSSKTASGAQGERQVTVPLHDNLGPLQYKLTDDASLVRRPATVAVGAINARASLGGRVHTPKRGTTVRSAKLPVNSGP